MQKRFFIKTVCLFLAFLMLFLLCVAIGGCSAEKYFEEGDFEKAFERAVKDGNKELQEKILWTSAIYGAIWHYDYTTRGKFNSSNEVVAAYYLIESTGDPDGNGWEPLREFVVIEYEDVLSYIDSDRVYQKYELYSHYGTGWGYDYEGYDNSLWDGTERHTYTMKAEEAFSSIKKDVEISYVVANGKKFTKSEYEQIRNMEIEQDAYQAVSKVPSDLDFQFVYREESVEVEKALQGKWRLHSPYGYDAEFEPVIQVEGNSYIWFYETTNISGKEGNIKIEENRILFGDDPSSNNYEFLFLYQTRFGYLIMLREYGGRCCLIPRIE